LSFLTIVVGDDGSSFHRNLIRPAVLCMLDHQSNERILDAACGNGVFFSLFGGVAKTVSND
jgi:hypothetical protein